MSVSTKRPPESFASKEPAAAKARQQEDKAGRKPAGGRTAPPRRERPDSKLASLASIQQNATGRINANRRVMAGDILEVATEIFAKKGYLGTNLGDVAEGLGVTRQALYYHFRAKQDILMTIFAHIFDDLDEAIEAATMGVEDPAERFRRMVRAHFNVVTRSPHRTAISLHEHRYLPPAGAKLVIERRQQLLQAFAKAYEAGVAAGAFRPCDPLIMSQLIIGSGTSMYRWFQPKGKLTVDQMAAFADEILAAGYANPNGGSDPA